LNAEAPPAVETGTPVNDAAATVRDVPIELGLEMGGVPVAVKPVIVVRPVLLVKSVAAVKPFDAVKPGDVTGADVTAVVVTPVVAGPTGVEPTAVPARGTGDEPTVFVENGGAVGGAEFNTGELVVAGVVPAVKPVNGADGAVSGCANPDVNPVVGSGEVNGCANAAVKPVVV
jgi:hypothetical protein